MIISGKDLIYGITGREEVDNLADTFDDNLSQYTSFLQSYADPEDFFNSLNHPDDRFSWIDPDYNNLENQLSGISASNGMKFILYRRCSGCETLMGSDLCLTRF